MITLSSQYNAPSRAHFQKLNILDINQLNDFLVSCACFHVRSKSLPEYFNDFCSENIQVHNHFTRRSSYLHKKFNRTNLAVYSTRNKVKNIWKNQPNEIKLSISLEVFKKMMKKLTLFFPKECHS